MSVNCRFKYDTEKDKNIYIIATAPVNGEARKAFANFNSWGKNTMKGTLMRLRYIAETKLPLGGRVFDSDYHKWGNDLSSRREQPDGPGWEDIPGWKDDMKAADIHPDKFYRKKGAVPFIYTTDKLMWSDDDEMSHMGLIGRNREYFAELYGDLRDSYNIRKELEESALVGRISPNLNYVAFWNTPNQLHGLLVPCINELLENGMIAPDTRIVLIGLDKTATAEYTVNNANPEMQTKTDPKQEREMQLRKELHLMQPQAKKAAMKELGLSFGSRKNPWQKASEKTGLVQPGQKWWAPTSESK